MKRHAKASSAGSTTANRGRRMPLALLGALVLAIAVFLGVSLASAAPPALTIEPASEVGVTAAKVKGTIDPQGQPTTYRFQYITEAQFQANLLNSLPGFEGATTGIEAGTEAAESLEGQLTNLTAGTTYHLRLQAEHVDGSENAIAATFTTQAATAPTLAINPASAVFASKAHISGTVDPEGGNENPAGDAVPIFWQLQYSPDPVNVGWQPAESGTIEGPEAKASAPIEVPAGGKDLAGLQSNTEYKFRLVASYAGKGALPAQGSFTTLAVSAPIVTIEGASLLTATTARFTGHVSAGGTDPAFDSACEFDYVTDAQFKANKKANETDENKEEERIGFEGPAGHITCEPNPVTGSGETEVKADPTGLEPNTTYHLRLRASNQSAAGQVTAIAPGTFSTEKIAPIVTDAFATSVTETSATLNAEINPGGDATTYHFEYLTLAEYKAAGETFVGAKQTPESASIGSDNQVHTVSANIGGLTHGSAYRFRVVATNSASATLGATTGFVAQAPAFVQSCPNEQLRAENNSLALPDCRAYELVTPDLNHATPLSWNGVAAPDGNTVVYQAYDAPDQANSAAALSNHVRAKRDPATGWSGISLTPPLPRPATAFASFHTIGISADLSAVMVVSDQPLSGGTVPGGLNVFLELPDGTYRLLTTAGSPFFGGLNSYPSPDLWGGTPDYRHVYLRTIVKQLDSDPTGNGPYSWSEEGGLRLLAILEDGTPAPNGATLTGGIGGLSSFSDDGRYVAFVADDTLYLRTDETTTTKIGPSNVAGLAADGSKLIFTSQAELTPDANTGPGEAGRDLYSYDTASGQLTDLTVDTNPADAATGAGVQRVFGASANGSYLYFTATGNLAPGATPGEAALYVWHGGQIDFVTGAASIELDPSSLAPRLYTTPDGAHIAFNSRASLTGYDNTDPVTGQPHSEVFVYAHGGDIACASCRTDGTRPTGNSSIPTSIGTIRAMGDDGERTFFNSRDRVVPQASDGSQQVFEYSNGRVSAISRLNGKEAKVVDVSASGSDVFFGTYDEIIPNRNGGDPVIYDARIEGGFPVRVEQGCSGVSCRGPEPAAPEFSQPASRTVDGIANRHGTRRCKKPQVRKGDRCVKRKSVKKPTPRGSKKHSGGAR